MALRLKGNELLRRSADVDVDDRAHPAYARILDEIAPDEARIPPRLLAREGAQPAVDVRTSQLIGLGSQLVAEGLSMVAQQARLPPSGSGRPYLNNLNRLGLIRISPRRLRLFRYGATRTAAATSLLGDHAQPLGHELGAEPDQLTGPDVDRRLGALAREQPGRDPSLVRGDLIEVRA